MNLHIVTSYFNITKRVATQKKKRKKRKHRFQPTWSREENLIAVLLYLTSIPTSRFSRPNDVGRGLEAVPSSTHGFFLSLEESPTKETAVAQAFGAYLQDFSANVSFGSQIYCHNEEASSQGRLRLSLSVSSFSLFLGGISVRYASLFLVFVRILSLSFPHFSPKSSLLFFHTRYSRYSISFFFFVHSQHVRRCIWVSQICNCNQIL